jgi:PAS domain S-box-containing protein
MDYEKFSHEELVSALRELQHTQAAKDGPAQERLLHELQVHQVELEMQNRELREAQGELEESRNRYADLYDFAPVAYCTLDVRGSIEELNLTAATLFGRERDRALGQPFARLVSLENPERFWHHLSVCVATARPVVSEFTLLLNDRKVHVEAVSVPVMDLGAKPRAFRTAFTDITHRKRAEAEREVAYASEQRLRSLLEALDHAQMETSTALASQGRAGLEQVMATIVRHARRITEARWARLELSRQAGLFWPVKNECKEDGARCPADHEGPETSAPLCYAGRTVARLSVGRAADDVPFAQEARHALAMLAERLVCNLEIARLHAVGALETLRLSLLERVASKLRSAQESAAITSAVGDIAQEIVPDFADVCLVHLTHDGELRLSALHHVDPDQRRALAGQLRDEQAQRAFADSLSELARSREPHLIQLAVRELSGAEAPPFGVLTGALQATSLIIAPLWARNRLLGTLCFGRFDPSETYDLRSLSWAGEIADRCASALDTGHLLQELREAVQWRENLMAMISHDLKNPLSAISLSAQSMTPETPVVERRSSHKQVDLIRRSANHMQHMINDLLSASLLEAGSFRVELRRESAYELLEEACELAEPLLIARSLVLEKAFVKDLPFVFADREAVQRVFSNLLGNAAKFTPQGGRICVSASSGHGRVLFSVRDTGPGIREEHRSHLFERYWKGRKSGLGLGLGLYISKAIVEAHEGRIWIEGDSEPGSTFCFELRRCDPAH